ncbi:hypothetical protein BKA62DRAFT_662187 [Auriculariales sp. MPI-PUGE-AT-0066]|nr:hypothetical protein BKA62DRAFT_662187 [Auriculariales sp. MPI-PUGE-AT-0066]
MSDLNDPNLIRGFSLIAYLSFGIAVWEFLISFDFDWEILRRKRRLTFGTILYLLCRYSNVFTACVFLVTTNASRTTPCEIWIYIQYGAASCATNIATGLLYTRVWALSNGYPLAVWGIGLPYAGAWGVIVYSTYMTEGQYIAALSTCLSDNVEAHRIATIYQLAVDLVCLVAMIWLLIRMHRKGTSSLWWFLMQQGVAYFVVICLVYIFDVVCSSLPLNKAIAMTPSLLRQVVTFIAATRMQRGLIVFVETRPVVASNPGGSIVAAFSRTRSTRSKNAHCGGPAVDLWIRDEDLKHIESGEHTEWISSLISRDECLS